MTEVEKGMDALTVGKLRSLKGRIDRPAGKKCSLCKASCTCRLALEQLGEAVPCNRFQKSIAIIR